MIAFIFAYSYGILLLFMVGEVHSPILKWTGYIAAGWMILAGSIAGWQAARRL